jgi:hypothetical protein
MICRAFAVVFSWMRVRIRCPVLQVSLPEVYDETAEINGLTILQLLFVIIRLRQTIHGRLMWADQQSLDHA